MTESSAQPLCVLVTSCLMAVRKPCGLKKPVTQKTCIKKVNIHFLARKGMGKVSALLII